MENAHLALELGGVQFLLQWLAAPVTGGNGGSSPRSQSIDVINGTLLRSLVSERDVDHALVDIPRHGGEDGGLCFSSAYRFRLLVKERSQGSPRDLRADLRPR